jgi:nucleotide-binding universal stress UspA family protein
MTAGRRVGKSIPQKSEMSTRPKHHGVVVGVDGSPASRYAVDWAAREAAMRDVPLTLVHVISPTTHRRSYVATPGEITGSDAKNAEALLLDAREIADAALEESFRIELDSEILTADIVPALIDLSRDSELLVVGRRGLGAVGRRVLGSVSRSLIHHARCPIAVIHDEDPLLASPVTEAPVVLGVDDSHVSEAVLGMAFDEAYRRGVDVVAVHARTDLVAGRLARWQRRYPEVGVRRIMARDRPAHQLVEECASAQLLVVARRGGEASAFGRESTTDAVVESARMPVIVTDDHETAAGGSGQRR